MCIREDPFSLPFCVPFPFFSQTVRPGRAFARKGKPWMFLVTEVGVCWKSSPSLGTLNSWGIELSLKILPFLEEDQLTEFVSVKDPFSLLMHCVPWLRALILEFCLMQNYVDVKKLLFCHMAWEASSTNLQINGQIYVLCLFFISLNYFWNVYVHKFWPV